MHDESSREDEDHRRPLRPVDGHDDTRCRSTRRWWHSSGFVSVRDVILFAAGLGIIGHQVFVAEAIEPTVLLIGAAAAGLPLIFENRPKERR